MNRRDFLKFLTVGAISSAIPNIALSSTNADSTITNTLRKISETTDSQIEKGIILDMLSSNPFYELLPFYEYEGQGIIINIAEEDGKFIQKVFSSTRIVGDVEIGTLSENLSYIDQLVIEISSKAKSMARLFYYGMINHSGTLPQMESFNSLPHITFNTKPEQLTFSFFNKLLGSMEDVDFIQINSATMRQYKLLLRSIDASPAKYIYTLPDGRTTLSYRDIPIFRNDYIQNETRIGEFINSSNLTSMWVGKFDDGSNRKGLTAIYPKGFPGGVYFRPIGKTENNITLYRMCQYVNILNINHNALVKANIVL